MTATELLIEFRAIRNTQKSLDEKYKGIRREACVICNRPYDAFLADADIMEMLLSAEATNA